MLPDHLLLKKRGGMGSFGRFGFLLQLMLIYFHCLIGKRNNQKALAGFFGNVDIGAKAVSPFFREGDLATAEFLEEVNH